MEPDDEDSGLRIAPSKGPHLSGTERRISVHTRRPLDNAVKVASDAAAALRRASEAARNSEPDSMTWTATTKFNFNKASSFVIQYIDSHELKALIDREDSKFPLLIFDLRPRAEFLKSRIENSQGFPIDSVLFESLNLLDLLKGLDNVGDLDESKLKDIELFTSADHIVLYGENSTRKATEGYQPEDKGVQLLHHSFLNVFVKEGWEGQAYYLSDGFKTFSAVYPERIDSTPTQIFKRMLASLGPSSRDSSMNGGVSSTDSISSIWDERTAASSVVPDAEPNQLPKKNNHLGKHHRSSTSKISSSKSKSKSKKDDWSEVTDPEERRRVQNRIAQRKFRDKAKDAKERQDREAENRTYANLSYQTPVAEDMVGDDELSGLPWGSLSMRLMDRRGERDIDFYDAKESDRNYYKLDTGAGSFYYGFEERDSYSEKAAQMEFLKERPVSLTMSINDKVEENSAKLEAPVDLEVGRQALDENILWGEIFNEVEEQQSASRIDTGVSNSTKESTSTLPSESETAGVSLHAEGLVPQSETAYQTGPIEGAEMISDAAVPGDEDPTRTHSQEMADRIDDLMSFIQGTEKSTRGAYSAPIVASIGVKLDKLKLAHRLQWTCRCGHKSYDDFQELRKGGVQDFADELLKSGYITQAQVTDQTSTKPSRLAIGSNNLFVGAKRRIGRFRTSLLPIFSTSVTTGPIPMQCVPAQNCRWLHMCLKKRPYATKLKPLHLCKDDDQKDLTDATFFDVLRKTYYVQKSWSERLLFKLRKIEFVEFELCPDEFVDHIIPNQLPPSTDEYDFQPPPPPKKLPPIGEAHLMHLFTSCSAPPLTTSLYLRHIPRKKSQALCFQADKIEGNTGWGLHFVETLNGSLAVTVMFIMSLILGVVFAVCWSVWKKDVQGAFGVAAYLTSVMTLAVMTWQMWAT